MNKKILSALFFAAAVSASAMSQPAACSLSGTVSFSSHGDLILSVFTKKSYDKMHGSDPFIVKRLPDTGVKGKGGTSVFSVGGLPPGDYVITCFQDENGNGRLDMGITGPKEPWGMANLKKKPMFGKPGTEDVAISVKDSITDMHINVD